MAWMETADLWVRPSQEADLELFYQWERRPEVTQFFSIADGQSRAEVEAIYRRDAADPGRRQYTILLKPEGRPIGRIVLADRIEGWKVEIFRIYIADTKPGRRTLSERPIRSVSAEKRRGALGGRCRCALPVIFKCLSQ